MRKATIGDLLSDGFRYSTTPYKRAILLGILYLLSFLIIPMFLALGYIYRCIKGTIDGRDELPEYGEWGRMLIDGLKLFVAYLIVIIPVVIIAFLFAAAPIGLAILNPYAMIGAMIPFFITALIIVILAGLYLFMAIPYMIYTGRIGAVFSFSEVMERIRRIGYGRYFAICIVTIIIAWLLGLISSLIPVIGVILITPIAIILMARVEGQVFKESMS